MNKSELRTPHYNVWNFGCKQCSEFEELCTGTAEEVLYSMCLRSAGPGAKQCCVFEGKISCQIYSQAQPNMYCIHCVLRSESSGAKPCSACEEKISKSEPCTGTAEELLYPLCFRSEGSEAKQCSGFEGEISKSELCGGSVAKQCSGFEGKISKSELSTGTAEEVLSLSIYCVL